MSGPGKTNGRPAAGGARRLLANTAWLTGANVLGRVLGYLSFLLLTRSFPNAQIGIYAVLITGFLLALVVGNLGLDKIIIRDLASRPADEPGIFGAALVLKAGASLLAYAAATAGLLLVYPELRPLAVPVGIFLTTIVTVALSQLLESVCMAHERMWLPAFAQMVERLAQLLACLAAFFGLCGFGSLLVLLALGSAARLATPLLAARRLLPRPDFRGGAGLFRELRGEAVRLLAVEALAGIYFRVDIFLLARLATFEATGLYQAAYKVLDFFVAIFAGFLMAVIPALTREGHEDRFRRMLLAGFAVVLPGAAAAIWLRDPILGLFGEEYRQAGTVLALLLAAGPLVYLTSMLANYAITLGQASLLVRLAAIMVALNLGLNLVLIPLWSIQGAAWATLVCEAVSLGLLCHSLRDCLFNRARAEAGPCVP